IGAFEAEGAAVLIERVGDVVAGDGDAVGIEEEGGLAVVVEGVVGDADVGLGSGGCAFQGDGGFESSGAAGAAVVGEEVGVDQDVGEVSAGDLAVGVDAASA